MTEDTPVTLPTALGEIIPVILIFDNNEDVLRLTRSVMETGTIPGGIPVREVRMAPPRRTIELVAVCKDAEFAMTLADYCSIRAAYRYYLRSVERQIAQQGGEAFAAPPLLYQMYLHRKNLELIEKRIEEFAGPAEEVCDKCPPRRTDFVPKPSGQPANPTRAISAE